jgi:phosphatidylinositol alpha-1,6-mannosyltransferase
MVTRNMPPLRGGMERLNLEIAIELAKGFDLVVVGPRGCAASLPDAVTVVEADHRSLGRFLLAAFFRAVQLAARRRPALVLAGSGVTAPIAFVAARVSSAQAAVYAHGLDLVAPHAVYRLGWLPFLRRMDRCIVNSRHTSALAQAAGIPADRITVLNPGVAPAVSNDAGAASRFRERRGLDRRKVLISVGRLTARKGTLEFVEGSLPAIVAGCREAVFVIIGDEAPDALAGSGKGMFGRIADAARRIGLEDHVRILGPLSEPDLFDAYEAADVLVFPVREVPGDVEGFGMVAIEAAAHGVPTIAFAVGGIPDAVLDGHSGWLVPPGDYATFADRVLQSLASASQATRDECRTFASRFFWDAFGARLRRLCAGWLARAPLAPEMRS